MLKKNITIEDLADLMGKRFDGVEKKFDGVEKKFDSVEKKIEDEISGLAAMTKREFDKVYEKTDKTQKQVESLRKEHLIHDFKMTEMVHKADYFKLEERVEILEKKVLINR